MEVIQEIVDFLFRRSELTAQDIERLAVNGLLEGTLAESLFEYRTDAEQPLSKDDYEWDNIGEFLQASYDKTSRCFRQTRSRRFKAKPLGQPISNRLLDCFDKAEASLSVLTLLASQWGHVSDRSSALKTLVRARDRSVVKALARLSAPAGGNRGLTPYGFYGSKLWTAASFAKFRDLRKPHERGVAFDVYEALLSGAKRNELGRNANQLRAPGLAELERLLIVQRRLNRLLLLFY